MTHDDDEDFPLADHPGPGGPKAGDPEMNRARDIQHLDVPVITAKALPPSEASGNSAIVGRTVQPSTGLPESAPVMSAWRAFQTTDSYMTNPRDNGFTMFLAGWSARDAQPKE